PGAGLAIDDDREKPVEGEHPGHLVKDHGLEEPGADDERCGDPDEEAECLKLQGAAELAHIGARENCVDAAEECGEEPQVHGATPSRPVSSRARRGTMGGKSTYPKAGWRPLAR